MYLPSRKLLSVVFCETIENEVSISKSWDEINGIDLEWDEISFNFRSYPLHYVMHKCKEWAWDIKSVEIQIVRNNNGFKAVLSDRFNMDFDNILEDYAENIYCVEELESEAIFKACEYILEKMI